MAFRQNNKLTKWEVDKIHENNSDKIVTWQSGKLIKWQVDRMSQHHFFLHQISFHFPHHPKWECNRVWVSFLSFSIKLINFWQKIKFHKTFFRNFLYKKSHLRWIYVCSLVKIVQKHFNYLQKIQTQNNN